MPAQFCWPSVSEIRPHSRARLHQELAEAEAEFTHLLLSLGERSLPGRPEKMAGTLKEQLDSITPALREMRLRKEDRLHHLGKALTNLWNLMDTPNKDLQLFSHVTSLLSVSSAEVSDPGSLCTTGEIDHADLVMNMDQQISRAEEEASSRKTIMEKVEKWMLARDEERLLGREPILSQKRSA